MSDQLQVKFTSNPDLIGELEALARKHPDSFQIQYSGPELDPMEQPFGLVEVGIVVGIISGTLYIGEVATELYRWSKENGVSVGARTAVGEAEITPHETSEEVVKRKLEDIVGEVAREADEVARDLAEVGLIRMVFRTGADPRR